MTSPFTGGDATKKHKTETYSFRNEEFAVERYYYVCNDTGRTFSDANLDNQVLKDIYTQYRNRHNIPSPQMLKGLRQQYGFSSRIMSKIAGIGINQYGLYESGEMPTIVIGQKLATLFDPNHLLDYIDIAQQKLGKQYMKVRESVEKHASHKYLPLAKIYYRDFFETTESSRYIINIKICNKARWNSEAISYSIE